MSVKLYFESCKKCRRAGSTTAEGKCYHCGADYTKELGMLQPDPKVMTPEQQAMQTRRLFLEEQIQTTQRYLFDLVCECNHFIVKREDSAVCDVCGSNLGWYCPVNPEGYCEYEGRSGDCKFCGIPSERK